MAVPISPTRSRPTKESDAELKDMAALMQHLGYRQYDVVGYSRGAILAARLLAVSTRKRVRRAVLGGMGIGFADPKWFRRWHFYESLDRPGSHSVSGTHNNTMSSPEFTRKVWGFLKEM
jgi:pimeloyl-ACP methyl ester carboxylesterase